MEKEAPILPDPGDHVMVVMRYKDTELAFAMRPAEMESGFIPTVQRLRELVVGQVDV